MTFEREIKSHLKHVLAVFQLDESSVRFILESEEQFGDLFTMTLAALGRTRLTTDPDALVSTW